MGELRPTSMGQINPGLYGRAKSQTQGPVGLSLTLLAGEPQGMRCGDRKGTRSAFCMPRPHLYGRHLRHHMQSIDTGSSVLRNAFGRRGQTSECQHALGPGRRSLGWNPDSVFLRAMLGHFPNRLTSRSVQSQLLTGQLAYFSTAGSGMASAVSHIATGMLPDGLNLLVDAVERL